MTARARRWPGSLEILIATMKMRYWTRGKPRRYAQRLRTFFRFAEHRGWCAAGLAGIMPSRFHADETVPKGLARDEVLRLLATTEGNQPVDVRDRALLMVLIAYGLRSGEVAGLLRNGLNLLGLRPAARRRGRAGIPRNRRSSLASTSAHRTRRR